MKEKRIILNLACRVSRVWVVGGVISRVSCTGTVLMIGDLCYVYSVHDWKQGTRQQHTDFVMTL